MSNLLMLVALPFASTCILLATSLSQLSSRFKKALAFALSLLPLALLLYGHGGWEGASINHTWISTLNISFHLQVDPLSLFFVYLTAIILPIAITTVQSSKDQSLSFYYALISLLQGVLLILFTARDLALFTIAWEAVLLPLFFIISLWGGPHRKAVALQFLVFMIAGSVFLVAAVLGLYFANSAATFDLDVLAGSAESAPYAGLLFAIFILAFAVKTPLFPFHGWLPETYVESPFAGTILLSALLSKAGIYGIARIGFGLFPDMMAYYSPLLLSLAITGALYGAVAAWTQKTIKGVIAYSSLSHVNFILAGLFIASPLGFQGAIIQAFNHGVTIAALFLVAFWLQQRTGESLLGITRGLAKYFPRLCWLTLFFALAAVALPLTNNFVGEFIILFALFKENPWLAATLALAMILSAIYMLRWMQKIYFEEPREPITVAKSDIGKKEILLALPLASIILAVGIYPLPLIREIEPAANKITPPGLISLEEQSAEVPKSVLVRI